MSHPDPHHDPENVRTADHQLAPKKKAMAKKMSPLGKLKSMMDDKPVSIQDHMDWFKKHGTPKNTSVTKRF